MFIQLNRIINKYCYSYGCVFKKNSVAKELAVKFQRIVHKFYSCCIVSPSLSCTLGSNVFCGTLS